MAKIYPFKQLHTKEIESVKDAKVIGEDTKNRDEIAPESDSEDDIIERIREDFKPIIGKKRVLESIPTDEESEVMESDDCWRFICLTQTDVEGDRTAYKEVMQSTRKQKQRKPKFHQRLKRQTK